MNNRELDQEMATQVLTERKAKKEIIRLLVLAQQQNLCGELGYADLADWLIRRHKVSERTAYRKIKAAKLSMSVPGVLEKIESGQLSVTKAARVQAAIRAHEKFADEKLSVESKSEVIQKVEALGDRETEQTLLTFFPELGSEVRETRTTVITPEISRFATNLPNEVLQLIERAKQLLSHSIPDGSHAEVFKHVFNDFLDRKDPLRKIEKEQVKKTQAAIQQRKNSQQKKVQIEIEQRHGDQTEADQSKRIRGQTPTQSAGTCRSVAATKREALQKSSGKCEFVDHKTKQVCGSTYQVQVDHIMPKAIGGSDEPENLRCLCRRHNLYMAEVNLGIKAGQWKERRQ